VVCNSKTIWDVTPCLWIVADVSKDSIAFVLEVKPSKKGSDAEDKPNIPESFNLEQHHCENLPPRKRFKLFCITEFCLFPWASAASHGCTAASWLIVPPALDVPTVATRCPRAYRRVPHSSGGSWNLWAGIRTDNFA
jgi:hypothetical protein